MFRIITEGKAYREHVLLRDGLSILFRVATPADADAVDGLMKRVSRDSLHMRFMGGISQVSRRYVEDLCTNDPRDRACLLAVIGEGEAMKVVGVGNYVALGSGNRAEVAFLVEDAYQGRGISTLLLERIAGLAAGQGFVGFEADVLYDNQPMLKVFQDSGFEARQALEGGTLHVEFPVSAAVAVRERAELRDRIASANSLIPLLRPRTVAVVGASRDHSAVGSLIFRHMLRNNFAGTVYPVNNQASSVNGVRTYPSVRDLPEPADLVVIAVPASAVLEVAEDALQAGAKGLLVVASGFAEAGPEGAALQRRLLEMVRCQGARLVGPNCLGVINTDPELRLNASLAPSLPPKGRVGFYSHSAALGLVILGHAADIGLGFSTFVSAGNRADVSGNDLLQYWEEDPATDMALLYLETFGNPRRFARIARRISARKPLLCVKSARSRAGRDAAKAHLGAPTQGEAEVEALFHQAGVIRAETLEQMFDTAVLLAHQPLPNGNRVAIISNSGGVVTICADACEANGMEVSGPGCVDLGAMATAEDYERTVEQALVHEDVDSLIAIFACIGDCNPEPVGRAIGRGVLKAENRIGVRKPTLLCLMGAAGAVQVAAALEAGGSEAHVVFPSYRFPEAAAFALGRAIEYAEYRRHPPGRLLWYEDVEAAAARRRAEAIVNALPARDAIGWLEGDEAWQILAQFGIRIAPEQPVPPAEDLQAVSVGVRSHRHFGPLIRLGRRGKQVVERITPLTDNDAMGMVAQLGLPADEAIAEMLGRMSQFVEEVPWLWELDGHLAGGRETGEGPLSLRADVRMGFRRPEAASL